MKQFAYIDALRGWAVLGVLIVHTSLHGLHLYPDGISEILYEGARGVQLFYVISAFTLFLSFDIRNKQEHFPVQNFFIRRFFRIAPLYYLAILYYLWQDGLGARGWLGDATHISGWNIAANVTFLHGLYPYWINSLIPGGWSIGVEMLFYLLIPLLFYKIKNLNQAIVVLGIAYLLKSGLHYFLLPANLITSPFLWHNYLFLYFPSQFPIFIMGIIAFFILIKKEKTVSFTSLAFAIVSFGINFYVTTPEYRHIAIGIWAFLFLGLLIGLSIKPIKFFVNPFFIYLGKISYGAYLTNWAVLHWLEHYQILDIFPQSTGFYPYLNFITKLILVTIFVILIAGFLWKYVEQPLQRVGKSWIEKRESESR